jgi:diphosphomevalonate decarboxylase
MRAIILVVSDKEKDTSSTSGMETSRLTSPLLRFRAAEVVQPRLDAIEAAYLARDFETFGKITMQDSNQFHAVCLDTYPPIFYMNDTSKAIIRLVHVINAHFNRVVAAYTFDAGPNAVLYLLEQDVELVLSVMAKYFPSHHADVANYCSNPTMFAAVTAGESTIISGDLRASLEKTGCKPNPGDVKFVFVTKSGPGPIRQPAEESLLNPETGLPVPPNEKHRRLQISTASH